MLYFALGMIAGLLVNPFRAQARKAIEKSFQNVAKREKVSFVDPKEDITRVTSLKDYLHE